MHKNLHRPPTLTPEANRFHGTDRSNARWSRSKSFLHGKGFALVLAACLLAAAAAGVWAVRTVRDELRQNLTDLTNPSSTARQTIPEPEPDPDVGLEEEELWLDLPDTAEQAANSVAGVPQPVPGSLSASSGAASGSGSVHEPSALRTDSAPAASSAAPASTQPFSGRVLNAYSGDELVYSKTLGDWRSPQRCGLRLCRGQ